MICWLILLILLRAADRLHSGSREERFVSCVRMDRSKIWQNDGIFEKRFGPVAGIFQKRFAERWFAEKIWLVAESVLE